MHTPQAFQVYTKAMPTEAAELAKKLKKAKMFTRSSWRPLVSITPDVDEVAHSKRSAATPSKLSVAVAGCSRACALCNCRIGWTMVVAASQAPRQSLLTQTTGIMCRYGCGRRHDYALLTCDRWTWLCKVCNRGAVTNPIQQDDSVGWPCARQRSRLACPCRTCWLWMLGQKRGDYSMTSPLWFIGCDAI